MYPFQAMQLPFHEDLYINVLKTLAYGFVYLVVGYSLADTMKWRRLASQAAGKVLCACIT